MKNFILVALCFLMAACAATETPNKTVANSNAATAEPAKTPDKPKFIAAEAVKFSVAKPIEIKAGNQTEAEVQIKIQTAYHVNSNPPSEKGFIPLEIALENSGGLIIGKPIYPEGEKKAFAFSENKPLSVYTGEIVVKLPLKADKMATTGQHQLTGKLTFQPCDEEVCYRPQTVAMTLPVTVN